MLIGVGEDIQESGQSMICLQWISLRGIHMGQLVLGDKLKNILDLFECLSLKLYLVKSLTIQRLCKLSAETLVSISEKCTNLKCLKIEYGISIAEASIVTLLHQRPNLEDIDLCTPCSGLASIFSGCSKLMKIVLPGQAIDDAVLQAIGQHCPNVVYLDLVLAHTISDDGILALADGCCTGL